VWSSIHSAVGTVTDRAVFAHTQKQQKMYPPLDPPAYMHQDEVFTSCSCRIPKMEVTNVWNERRFC